MLIYSDQSILILSCVYAVVLGAVFGSFLNCAAWRTAHGESFIKGHSRCPKCGHELKASDLIPVFSWLFLRGKCRYCGTRISVRYPASELTFALLTLLCLLRFDLSVLFLRNWVFLGCLFFLTITDLDSSIIPDGCLITAAAAWLLALPFIGWEWKQIIMHLLAGLAFGGGLLLLSLAMDKLLKKESLGGGDIKLFAVIGLYLGFTGTLFALIIACFIGLLLAFFVFRRGLNGKPFPFGPAIAVASAFMLLYGEGLTNWYLGLLGI